MLVVTDLSGNTEALTDYKSLQRKQRVNGEYSLSFLLFKTERNEHSFPLAVEESIVEYDGQEYRIKKVTEKAINLTPVRQIQADHIFFDLVDEFQYDVLNNTQTLSTCLAHALEGTGYTYEVIDSFSSAVVQNWGNETVLALIQSALNLFGAEIEINGKHLRFYRQIGRKTDIQFRFKHNIKTIEKYVDSSNLSTYIKGFGKKNEDGSYVVTADYTSPMVDVYGVRHAKPVEDERYTTLDGLLERLENELQDKPDISFKVEAVELLKAGIITEQLEAGDELFVIYEPLNIDITARVMEINEFPEEPTSNQFTLANFRSSIVDNIADFQRTKDRIDGIFEGKEKLPFNVLDDAVQHATKALQSAETELEFENGILAIDPRDPNRLVLVNSKGIGISNDGGKTFKEAITADGFVLSAGAIGQLSANNITVGDGTTFEDGYDPDSIISVSKAAANQAQADADAAIAKLADMSLDNKLTPIEKKNVKKEWDIIKNEAQEIVDQSISYGVDAFPYVSAYADLLDYIEPLLASTTTTSTIVRSAFDNRFKNYYYEKVFLLNAVSDKIKGIADAAKVLAGDASSTVNLWKYPNTTMINGGNIYTDSITTNKLKAGTLTGFIIQTHLSSLQPRIYMGGSKLEATDGGSNRVKIDPSNWGGGAGIQFTTPQTGSSIVSGGFIEMLGDRFYIRSNGAMPIQFLCNQGVVFQAGTDVLFESDLRVSGSKNAVVPSSIGEVAINAYETAEYYFGDIGRGEVINGECVIDIENLFKETVNTDIEYEVFLTPYGKGLVYIDSMNPDSFTVKGDDIPFAYEIKAKRKGYETVRLEVSTR